MGIIGSQASLKSYKSSEERSVIQSSIKHSNMSIEKASTLKFSMKKKKHLASFLNSRFEKRIKKLRYLLSKYFAEQIQKF